jgi:hypothetical protein
LYTLCFYVPVSALEEVKAAVFAAGAGRIGKYDQCCWQVEGEGQFRPLAGSNPAIGQLDQLETLPEYRVEMVCDADCIVAVVAALKAAHPYEEPAWHVLQMVTDLPG